MIFEFERGFGSTSLTFRGLQTMHCDAHCDFHKQCDDVVTLLKNVTSSKYINKKSYKYKK